MLRKTSLTVLLVVLSSVVGCAHGRSAPVGNDGRNNAYEPNAEAQALAPPMRAQPPSAGECLQLASLNYNQCMEDCTRPRPMAALAAGLSAFGSNMSGRPNMAQYHSDLRQAQAVDACRFNYSMSANYCSTLPVALPARDFDGSTR